MSNLTVAEWTTPTTPVHPNPVERSVSLATSIVDHILFPKRDLEDDISDSVMANSAFGGSRSILDESTGETYLPTAEERLKQELRAQKADLAKRETALLALKNTVQIFSEDDLEPYVHEIATKLKTFVETNKNGNKIFPGVLIGIVSLKGRLEFKRSRGFEAKGALVNFGVISNPMFDNSNNEFYMYNTSFVIPSAIPQRGAAVSGSTASGAAVSGAAVSSATVSQLPAVTHPSSSKLPTTVGTWKKSSSPNNILDSLAALDFDSLDFKTLKAIRSALMKTTTELDGVYNKKRAEMQAEMQALLEDA